MFKNKLEYCTIILKKSTGNLKRERGQEKLGLFLITQSGISDGIFKYLDGVLHERCFCASRNILYSPRIYAVLKRKEFTLNKLLSGVINVTQSTLSTYLPDQFST